MVSLVRIVSTRLSYLCEFSMLHCLLGLMLSCNYILHLVIFYFIMISSDVSVSADLQPTYNSLAQYESHRYNVPYVKYC